MQYNVKKQERGNLQMKKKKKDMYDMNEKHWTVV